MHEEDSKVTLSGNPADLEYWQHEGGAPQPVDPATGMHKDYWVLSKEERAKGFVRPVRKTYIHDVCGKKTYMHTAIAETFARDPKFYSGGGYCATCKSHFPSSELTWEDGSKVGS